jgi:hypothetical protein
MELLIQTLEEFWDPHLQYTNVVNTPATDLLPLASALGNSKTDLVCKFTCFSRDTSFKIQNMPNLQKNRLIYEYKIKIMIKPM